MMLLPHCPRVWVSSLGLNCSGAGIEGEVLSPSKNFTRKADKDTKDEGVSNIG